MESSPLSGEGYSQGSNQKSIGLIVNMHWTGLQYLFWVSLQGRLLLWHIAPDLRSQALLSQVYTGFRSQARPSTGLSL